MPPRRISLESTSTLVLLVITVGAAVAAILLVWVNARLRDGTRTVTRNIEVLHIIDDLEIALSARNRAAYRAAIETDPIHERRVREREAKVVDLLAQAEVITRRDAALHARVVDTQRASLEYIAKRRALEERAPPLEALVRAQRIEQDRAFDAYEAVREHLSAQSEEGTREADRLVALSRGVALTTALLAGLALFGLLIAVLRRVIAPLTALRDGIGCWRRGTPWRPPPAHGPIEIREIASAFGELAKTLEADRSRQLVYLAGVAHDLRGPLSAMVSACDVLRDELEAVEPEAMRWLDVLERQVTRLNRMTGDLLDATRIEAGQLDLKKETVDVGDAARTVIELHASSSTKHSLTLRVPPTPVLLDADPVRLEQVIGNLVSNAIKYAPDGGEVSVTVAAHTDEVWIEVRDTGVGIPAQDLLTIFEPYRRRAETLGLAGGAGLGLAVVQKVVEAHGGAIEVESTPGHGSCFRVRLPTSVAAADGATDDADATRPQRAA